MISETQTYRVPSFCWVGQDANDSVADGWHTSAAKLGVAPVKYLGTVRREIHDDSSEG